MKLKDYIEQLLENVADEVNVKEVRLEHDYASSVYSFDTINRKSIGLDEDWPLWALVLTGNLNKDMEKIREWVSVGLNQRAAAKMKVRQPLQSLTLSI